MSAVRGTRSVAVLLAMGAAAAASIAGIRSAQRFEETREQIALEARVLDEDIAFLEARVAADARNHVLAGHLVDRYAERFQTKADLEDLRRASQVATRLVADRTADGGSWARLSRILLTQHRFPEAFEAASEAVRLDSTDDAVLGVYVDAARSIGAYEEADAALARMRDGSTSRTLRTWKAAVRADAGAQATRRLRRVCARFDELGQTRDVRAWCRVRLADAAVLDDRRAEGERWLEEALRLQPDHRGAIETSAELALEDEEWGRAASLLERIATPAHPDIYATLAEAYRGLGRTRDADAAEARFLQLATAPGALDLNALFLARHYSRNARDCVRADGLIARELERRRSIEVLLEAAAVAEACGAHDRAGALRAEAAAIDARWGDREAEVLGVAVRPPAGPAHEGAS